MIDFDLPSVEIDLQEGLCVVEEIGGEQIGGISIIQLAALAFAAGSGRNDDEPQRLSACATLPIDKIDLFVAHDAPFASVEDFGGVPGDGVVFAHLLGAELVDVICKSLAVIKASETVCAVPRATDNASSFEYAPPEIPHTTEPLPLAAVQ